MADNFRLDWKGDELKRTMEQNGAKIISTFALTVEAEAKKELRRGHGVLTGTLRRSIHVALPGYSWGGDDVVPKKIKRKKGVGVIQGTPERGFQKVLPENSNRMTLEVGSGMRYAMAVHQGHGNFEGYHFLTNGLKKAQAKLNSIMALYRVMR
jgi:hypothetical protein